MSAKSSTVADALSLTAPAEAAFRSRWRLSTLARIAPELHQALTEQIQLYDTAMLTGRDDEVKLQSEAMVRGWRAACKTLEQPLNDDDAYFVGQDPKTGTKLVIGQCKQSIARVQSIEGSRAIFMTPDELAVIVAGLDIIAQAKTLFPDAEVVEMG
jgi:predicted exporter